MAGWGGPRPGAGRKPQTPEQREAAAKRRAEAAKKPVQTVEAGKPKAIAAAPRVEPEKAPAEARKGLDFAALAQMLPSIQEISEAYGRQKERRPEDSPFRIAMHPPSATPKHANMAQDSALLNNNQFATDAWLAGGVLDGIASEGLLFLGYPYLAELAQRPEYRVISETIADDATRRWIDFDVVGEDDEAEKRRDPVGFEKRQQDPDERKKRIDRAGKTDKIKALKDDQERLCVRERIYDHCRNDGFFGRSHLYLNTGADIDGNPAELATSIGDGRDAISRGKFAGEKDFLREIKVIEAVWTYPMAYNATNPLKPGWYDPQVWYVMGTEIHGSRLLTTIGHPVPDLLKPAYSFGGLSLSQMAKPYVDIWLNTRQSVADLIKSFSVMVLATDMQAQLAPGHAAGLLARVAMFNMFRDNQGAFVINKDTEQFSNVSASLAGLHELQAQAQEHMASVVRIPLVKFTGISPSGLNASSEGEIMVYDDTIGAYQNRVVRPPLVKIINFQQLSLFGEVDPGITFHFEPLRVMTEKERGEIQKNQAETYQKYVDMGALAPEEIRKAVIDDPDLPFADLDPDDVPDLLEEEAEGLEPQGGRPQPVAQEEAEEEQQQEGQAGDAVVPFAADDAHGWEESKHPRGPDGKFAAGGGGSGSSEESGAPKGWGTAEPGVEKKKKSSFGGLYSDKGSTKEENHKLTVAKVLSKPATGGMSYRQMLMALIKEAPKIGDPETVKPLMTKLSDALLLAYEKHNAAGDQDGANKIMHAMTKLNDQFASMGDKPAPKPVQKEAAAATAPPAAAVEPPVVAPSKDALKLAAANEQFQKNVGGKKLSPLESGKEKIKATVQTGGDVMTAAKMMTPEEGAAVAKQYKAVSVAFEKSEQYFKADQQNKKTTEEKKAQAKAAQEAYEKQQAAEKKKLEESLNSPEAKEHYKTLEDITSGSAKNILKHAADKLKSVGPDYKNLSVTEAALVSMYSGSYYREVNNQLRSGLMTEKQYRFAMQLNDALSKIAPKPGVTRRGANLSPQDIQKYKPGMIIEERGFTSSSKGSGFGGNVKYEIHGKTGRDIQPLSFYPGEAEVLFRAGTRFKVVSNDGKNIVLHEMVL